jgi:hypothetical protein
VFVTCSDRQKVKTLSTKDAHPLAYDGVALLLLVVHVCLLWKYAEAAEPESKLLSVRINRS